MRMVDYVSEWSMCYVQQQNCNEKILKDVFYRLELTSMAQSLVEVKEHDVIKLFP